MKKNFVSIIIPAYNAEAYIETSLKSIINQTFKNFEIIVIENGSTDKSLKKIIKLSKIDKRIKVFSIKKKSLSTALNYGIKKSKGEFIARMDADDISHPTRLSDQVNYLNKNKHISILGTNINLIDKDGKFIKKIEYPSSFKKVSEKLEIDSYIAHPTVMMRKNVFNKIGFYRYQLCPAEDYDLWLRALHFFKIENLKKTLLDYRQHNKKMGSTMKLQTFVGASYARELYKIRKNKKIYFDRITFKRLADITDLIKVGVQKKKILKELIKIFFQDIFNIMIIKKIILLITK